MRLDRRTILSGAGAIVGTMAIPDAAPAQGTAWPTRTVRLVAFGPAGGAPDLAARILAEQLSIKWKRTVVVEPKPGADGILAVQAVMCARDGHTLLFAPHAIHTTVHLVNPNIPFRPRDVLTPICIATEDFLGVFATSSIDVDTFAGLRDHLRANPGKLNWFGTSGTSLWLLGMHFLKQYDLAAQYVSYRGGPQVALDMSEGRLQYAFQPLSSMLGQVDAGKVRAVAVLNATRSPRLPSVPTVREQGFDDFTWAGSLGFYGPKDMPRAVIETITADTRAMIGDAALGERISQIGQAPAFLGTVDMTALLESNEKRMAILAAQYKQE